MKKIIDLVVSSKKRLEEISNGYTTSGIFTGFDKLDNLTSGLQLSELVTIGGRVGMGKTALALTMSRNISVNQNIPVVFFSLEMSSTQLMTRLLSSEVGLSSKKLRTAQLAKHEWEQLNVNIKELEKAPLFIDDTAAISVEELIFKVEKLVESEGIKLVFLDYLQLVTIKSKNANTANKEQEISYIVKKLKALAKRLDLSIILISQLNRALETRGGSKRPALIDFRDSGTIEEDSDLVCFLYRPEYYNIEEWDDEERSPSDGQAELIVAKHRNGSLDNIRLKFTQYIGKFDNLEKFEPSFEFLGSSDAANDDTFKTDHLPSADEAFGSSMNDDFNPDDNEVPF